jgi:hypothetical protein
MKAIRWLSLSLTLLLGACSSSGSIAVQEVRTGAIEPGRTISVSVEPVLPAEATEEERADADEFSHRLATELFGRLVSEGLFKHAVQSGQPADYRMVVAITSAEEISQGARIAFGIFAGSNLVTASVTVFEDPTGLIFTRYEVTGESASHPLSSENDIDDAVREAATQIIDGLKS